MSLTASLHPPYQTPPLDARSRELRRLLVRMVRAGNRGHIGSAMSLFEILRVLYDDILTYRVEDAQWADRDRCILSKGHGCIALYALLADKGFLPFDELDRFGKKNGILGGHPEYRKVPGVEASTGALGHGLPIAIGHALAARMQGRSYRTFVLMGDGEIQEGSVWEAALSAAKHDLDNLVAIVDYNKLQAAGQVREIMPLEPLAEKWRAFGWAVREVDGHDVGALRAVLGSVPFERCKPGIVIAHTVKGKGFSFAENDPHWHHQIGIKPEEIAAMEEELRGSAHA